MGIGNLESRPASLRGGDKSSKNQSGLTPPGQRELPAADTGQNQVVSDRLSGLLTRVLSRSERFVSGRYWLLEVLLLAVLFTVLFSGGIDDRLWKINENYPGAYFQKIEHPLADVGRMYPPSSHEAKLNFRLTVPVILHLLRVPSDERWVLPALAAGAVCALILISCQFAFEATRDRVCGLYIALGVASTYIGSFAFTFYYDAIAITQLALAMLPGFHWSLKGLLVFTACFTDERAFLASPLLLVQCVCAESNAVSARKRIFTADFLAVLGGMVCYCFGRLLLAKYAGLSSPSEGVGFGVLLDNSPFWHAGIWFALKGGWLLVGLAMFSLWTLRQFLSFGALAFAMFLTLCGGLMVTDVVRSTSYVFPALFVSLLVLGRNENLRHLRIYCLAAFILSAITGNYNVWLGRIEWFQPLAARFVEYLLHISLKLSQSGT